MKIHPAHAMTPTPMDLVNNKRKAPTSPSPPHMPRQAPPPVGTQYFPPTFGSPRTMPNKTNPSAPSHPASPTPLRAPLPPFKTTTTTRIAPEQPSDPAEDMEMSDSQDELEGIQSSIHAPKCSTPTPTEAQHEPTRDHLSPPDQPQTDNNPPDLFQTLSTVAETTMDMVTFSSSTRSETRFTNPPVGGFPLVHRGIPGESLQGLPPDTVTAWCKVRQPKFFVRFFGYDGKDQKTKHPTLTGIFRKAIEEIAASLGETEPKARIAPPPIPAPSSTPSQPLITFSASGITQPTAEIILKQRVWSLPEVTFEATPFEMNSIPTLILCIAGFTSPDVHDVEEAVTKVWSDQQTTSRLASILQHYDPAHAKGYPRSTTKNAINDMIMSLEVEFIDFKEPGGVPSPRFNIFACSPTKSLVAWSHIRSFLFMLPYPTLLSGVGNPNKLLSCQICHSFSHPRGLCPFPHLLGWNGQRHEPDRRSTNRGRARGCGRARGGRALPF